MDIFYECLVKKARTVKDNFLTALIIFGAVVLIAALWVVQLFIFSPLLIILIGYGAYFLVTSFKTEYEYILTNGELDIDKIIAQRKRKRLVTLDCKTLTEMGRIGGSDFSSDRYQTKILAGTGLMENAYYAVFDHKTMGCCLLIFNPDDRILSGMLSSMPAVLRTKLSEQLKSNDDK